MLNTESYHRLYVCKNFGLFELVCALTVLRVILKCVYVSIVNLNPILWSKEIVEQVQLGEAFGVKNAIPAVLILR